MISDSDIPFRLIVAAELIAMVMVRDYHLFFRSRESIRDHFRRSQEPTLLTAALGALALVHFGALIIFIANPASLNWSAFEAPQPVRWAGILISAASAAGEVWALISLGTNYNPLLRVGETQVLVTSGPYRWVRHPLYSFALPMMVGWGFATQNRLIIASGILLGASVMIFRVPREEAMMVEAFGKSYRDYATRTRRFIPRVRGR